MNRLTLTSLISFVMLASAPGSTYIVEPDGTGDYPFIQEAIDAAVNGDEILLGDGVFKGVGNYEVDFKGKAIIVRSQSGWPADCVIDAEGVLGIPRCAFVFQSMEWHDSVVRDLTIINGSTAYSC